MRIAESHRPAALFALVEARRPEGTAALLALAHADDVDLVLGRMAALGADRERADRAEILTVLRDVSYRRPTTKEPVDPTSIAACLASLTRIAQDATDEPALRAIAASALHGFARAERLDPAAIPLVADPLAVSPSAAPSVSAAASSLPP
jgi:hypothetical protein